MDAHRRHGADPVSRYARSCGRRPRGQGDARRSGQRAVRGACQRSAARDRSRPRLDPGKLRSARRRYARLARPALARDLWRERGARHRRGAPLGADARHQRQERPLRLGGAPRRDRAADRIGAPRHPSGRRRARRLRGRRMVGAGRRRGAAGAAASAPRGHADRRSLRRAGRKGGRTRRSGRRA